MKNLITIIASASILVGCQPAKTTPDNTVLLNKNYSVPNDFTGAQEQTRSVKKNIDATGAECIFDITTLKKDSLNSTLKSVKITLSKGVKNYEFSAKTSALLPALNSNRQALQNYADVSVSYYTESMKGKSTIWKHYAVNSLGEINEK